MTTRSAKGLGRAILAASVVFFLVRAPGPRAADTPWHDAMNAAEAAREDGRIEDAEERYRIAIREAERSGPQRLRLARSLDALADLYREQGRLAEAEPLYVRALDLWDATLGPNQPRAGITMHNLAAVYLADCRVDEALPLIRRVVRLWEETLGPDHPDRVAAIRTEAALLRRCGRAAEAGGLLEKLTPTGPD